MVAIVNLVPFNSLISIIFTLLAYASFANAGGLISLVIALVTLVIESNFIVSQSKGSKGSISLLNRVGLAISTLVNVTFCSLVAVNSTLLPPDSVDKVAYGMLFVVFLISFPLSAYKAKTKGVSSY